jgi:nucleoside-triphosphatase THEP1
MSETPRLCGFVCDDGVAAQTVMIRIVEEMRARGRNIAGAVQYDRMRPGRKHCDMFLENLATHHVVRISEDRGEGASGCRLDRDAFAMIETELLASLAAQPDLLIVNKFGKTEVEGGGLRQVIARAMELDIPVLVGVPRRNLASWNEFVGEFALAAETDMAVERWLAALA